MIRGVGAQAIARRRDLHPGGEELLDRQVVQIAPDAGPFIEQGRHLFGVLGVGQLEGHRRLPGHQLGDLQVLLGEGSRPLGAQQQHDPDSAAPVDHRGVQGRSESREFRYEQIVGPPGLGQRIHRHAGLMGQRRQRSALGWKSGPDETGGMSARRDLADPCLADAGQDQGGRVRVRDLAHPVGDQGQGVVLLGARQQQRRQLLRDGHPALAVPGLPVQSGVLHRDGGGLGEGEDNGGIPVVEATVLVAQVQASVEMPMHPQGRRQN